MDNKPRNEEIDILRGLAMFAMFFIHTSAYFLSDPLIKTFWNYCQFAVPVFIFCSAFIYYERKHGIVLKKFSSYLGKRFIRLLTPYYIFAIVYLLLVFVEEPAKLSLQYVFSSLFLTGGIDINWLVLLFLYLTILMPLLQILREKYKPLFAMYIFISIIFSSLIIIYPWKYDYRIIMWLPWSLLVIYTMYFVTYYKNKLFLVLSILLSAGMYILLYIFEGKINHSLTFYDNKYPPTLLILSFGIAMIVLLFILAKVKFFAFKPLKELLLFMSEFSYKLYFIHYLFLYMISFLVWKLHLTWFSYFFSVLFFSLITQYLLNVIQRKKV